MKFVFNDKSPVIDKARIYIPNSRVNKLNTIKVSDRAFTFISAEPITNFSYKRLLIIVILRQYRYFGTALEIVAFRFNEIFDYFVYA